MELKRYSHEELIPLCKEIFYDYMVSTNQVFWFDSEFKGLEEDCPTPIHQEHKRFLNLLQQNNERQKVYEEALHSGELDEDCRNSLNTQLNYLIQEHNLIKNSCMKLQKETYHKTKSVDYCRTCVRIPLNKLINSFYDDLTLEVVYYDDVSTLKGKYDEYEQLTSKEDRLEFFKKNTEVTHMGLALIRGNRHVATIGLLGKLNSEDPRIQLAPFELLDHKFSDFANLTLDDTTEIKNNDLRQFLQSKIDMDKENLEKLSSQEIRGDLYEIYKKPNTDELFIRYICRSTSRVYYNPLIIENLKLSKEFKNNNYGSYARAWWNINTLGGKVDGKPVIRL